MKQPIIGIVLDKEPGGGYSEYPYYVLREHYFAAVRRAGGIPVGLDHALHDIATYGEFCDGLVMPGGDYDIPPSFYGEDTVHESVVTKPERLDFDVALTKHFLELDKPILGICAGEQLIAVLGGATLVQDIASEIPQALSHYMADREAVCHEVLLIEGSLLKQIVGGGSIGVNSHHHQSVKTVGEQLLVSARSEDGVIEAIEIPAKKFCLGVQWHPEFGSTPADRKIFEAFVRACF